MRSVAVIALSIFLLAGCGDGGVNPPTEPAAAIPIEGSATTTAKGQTSMLPGRGSTSFVGRWAADVSWCAAPQGDRRPIEISSTRFDGYEHACEIDRVEEVADGYVATLACASEGRTGTERVRFQVTEDVMRLTYLDRTGDPVTLRKCTTLMDTSPTPAIVP